MSFRAYIPRKRTVGCPWYMYSEQVLNLLREILVFMDGFCFRYCAYVLGTSRWSEKLGLLRVFYATGFSGFFFRSNWLKQKKRTTSKDHPDRLFQKISV